MHVMQKCVQAFCNCSRQKVSKEKTKLFCSRNINHNKAMELSNALRVALTSNLGNYLRIPLHHTRVKKEMYRQIVEKVKKSLNMWKASTLSMAGRVTLAQSVPPSIPLYTMQTSLISKGVCDEVERLSRGFIWGDNCEKKKPHLVPRRVSVSLRSMVVLG